jgi:DNA-binding phage protein
MRESIAHEKNVEIFTIGSLMHKSHLPDEFISKAVRTAMEFEGVYDLMVLWREEKDKEERQEIIADIQDMIDDCSQKEYRKAAYIKFNDLKTIAENIREFKDSLLLIVDKKGGIKKLSKLSGIPQPSLSRFFNSNSMPRRTTLLKIADALKLSEVEIATEWIR